MSDRARGAWLLAAFACLSCLFMWRVVFAGQVFVPAQLLRWLAPWSASYAPDQRPPWNPLMYDSVGQFYPWRRFAGEEMRAGRVPLWNPYQFCGTPFVANSQSAILYPGNLLYDVLPAERAAGWTAVLHLILAASFMAAFLCALGVGPVGRAFGGVAYAFSAWQVSWLHLPTFLDTSCWLPLVLLLTLRCFERGRGRPALAVGLGSAIGMALLAGHLQVAFYVLLAAGLLAAWLAGARLRERSGAAAARGGVLFAVALVLGGLVAAPQILPTLELSRRSHRVAPPSAAGYEAYTGYAVHPNALATLVLPDFYGNPSRPDAPYFGMSRGGMYFNYAEGALYVGLLTLLLAAFALVRRRQPGRLVGWLGGLALLALLMALGTAVDWLLYFHVPGFGQSGSPGRALVLWAFALSALAALGLDRLLREDAVAWRAAAGACAAALAVAGLGATLGLKAVAAAQEALGEASWQPEIGRQIGLGALSAGLIGALVLGRLRRGPAAWFAVVLLVVDLFANGVSYNPTASASEVYPPTPAIARMRGLSGHDRVMPINSRWSFAGPTAVLPPNGATVFRLRDVQGYDSLFPGRYKAFLNDALGQDASPPEVGNMVFAKTPAPALADAAGVRVLAYPAQGGVSGADDGAVVEARAGALGRARLEPPAPGASIAWLDDRPTRVALAVRAPVAGSLTLADQLYPGWHATVDGRPAPIIRTAAVFRAVAVPAGSHTVAFAYQPSSFRVGLYLLACALAVGAATLGRCLCRTRPSIEAS